MEYYKLTGISQFIKVDNKAGLLISTDPGFERIVLLDEPNVEHLMTDVRKEKVSAEEFINQYNELRDRINNELIKK